MKLDDYAIQQLAPYMTGHTDYLVLEKLYRLYYFVLS